MVEHVTFSVDASFKERFNRLVPIGKKARFMVDAVTKELDILENSERERKIQERAIKEVYIPYTKQLLKGYEWHRILQIRNSKEERAELLQKLSELKVVISDKGLMETLDVILND